MASALPAGESMRLLAIATDELGQTAEMTVQYTVPQAQPPRFTEPTGAINIPQTLSVGDSFTRVQATGDGVQYSISGADAQYFSIDSTTG